MQTAILGGGCFWCLEAMFQAFEGIASIENGYCGGTLQYPTYKDICTGLSGHIEVVRITFDDNIISYSQILDIFWKIHNPTTLDRQGNDVGMQYRSVIFCLSKDQELIANESKKNASQYFDNKIVTEIRKEEKFWIAEDYHQNYYQENQNESYCQYVIKPKFAKIGK